MNVILFSFFHGLRLKKEGVFNKIKIVIILSSVNVIGSFPNEVRNL